MAPLFETNINTIYKPIILIGFLLFLYYCLVSYGQIDIKHQPWSSSSFTQESPLLHNDSTNNNVGHYPCNISHIVIGIASSINTWKYRKPYIDSWWQPNVTKGYLYLDHEPTQYLPWPSSSPPYRISKDTAMYKPYDKHGMREAIRIVRVVLETFREVQDDKDVKWFVMVDDDTILFLDNLVEILSKYDYRKYYYIGENSETILSNVDNSFEMAFGGGGYALSYPLAKSLANNLDVCIKRYPFLYGSDHILQSCVADLGVSLTHEKGFHQIDLHRDISGFLSSHPLSPILSLHHLDFIDPLFPKMDRVVALNHLMKAAKVDQARLLQQTICYDKSKKWSVSIAWGYTTQIYESIVPPSVLQKPLETFSTWRKPSRFPFMFNTRLLSKHPCDMPHVFYLDSIEKIDNATVITSYTRRSNWTLAPCPITSNANSSSTTFASGISKVMVISPTSRYSTLVETRRECCDVVNQAEKNITVVKYRSCMINEILGVN